MLVVCRKLGITDVFRVNGPAGIAALGFGTESIPRVRMVVGPGSPAVTLAQVEMQRHGRDDDDAARADRERGDRRLQRRPGSPRRRPADRGRARHRLDGRPAHARTKRSATAVDAELARQIDDLPDERAAAAGAALGSNGGCVVTADLDEAVAIANRIAPEHLQVAVDDSVESETVDAIVNAGEILVGQHTPFSAANFVIGCPASLPTSGFAHVSSGITAMTFLKRTAVAKADAVGAAADGAVDRRPRRPRGLPGPRRRHPSTPA